MPGIKGIRRNERGASTLAIVVAIGAVVATIGLAILFSTDAQLRGSVLGLINRRNDWAVRSSIKLVEEAWTKYLGIERVDATTFEGTVYNDVNKYSRDSGLMSAISLASSSNDPNYSLLVPLYEVYNATVDPSTTEMPKALIYQVDLTRDKPGFPNYQTNLDASDGIVFVARLNSDDTITAVKSVDNPENDNTYEVIWNNIDSSGSRRFNAIITLTPAGLPHWSADNVYFVFPIKFEIVITVNMPGVDNNIQKTVRGLGSCSFYIYRRSFSEYLVFSDVFTTETGGNIVIPKGFTYAGPVHTNTRFSFTGDPQGAVFEDYISQTEDRAVWNGQLEPDVDPDRISYNDCEPTFEKGFSKGVAEINPPTVSDLGDIPSQILTGVAPPTEDGVYLRTAGGTLNSGTTLDRGGIYIKGDVDSLTLSQDEREQTYTVKQSIPSNVNTTTVYYKSQWDMTETSQNKALVKVVTTTALVDGTVTTITSDYAGSTTTYHKVVSQYSQTVVDTYTRSRTWYSWPSNPSSSDTTNGEPTLIEDTTTVYSGLIDVVQAPTGSDETPQVAVYVDGRLGSGEAAGTANTPTGLSGTVDRETELTICVKDAVVITGDTIYERSGADGDDPTAARLDQQGILGLISVTSKVYIDYPDPVGKSVNIDASIMAVNDGADPSLRGVLTALDYTYDIQAPPINLYGGVVQKYYGAVGQSGTPKKGYSRNFEYDPRLRAAPPPLYPKQSACRMQLKNSTNDNTLQLIWNY